VRREVAREKLLHSIRTHEGVPSRNATGSDGGPHHLPEEGTGAA